MTLSFFNLDPPLGEVPPSYFLVDKNMVRNG